ncbi:MAG: bifunctional chorismate mutase/prephenate dehydrogenase [Desulfobacteraceae bacterium]|nr:bifunctional chorismate mutase/prephenate dehydrogenase [Desulfobacteraceae bacterium]MBC2757452.1 bifunctional chorismate mutase/prephenate dehydrogenase [Desulfobacteraceae bacterium]
MSDISQECQTELTGLRREIDAIDQQVVDLLSKRQKQVEHVVALKKAHNLQVYHPAREEDLISARRQQAREAGLCPDYIEELYRVIMRRSRVEQTGQMAGKAVKPGATVLIVGGTGEMGRYFLDWFNGAGYRVRSMGSKDWPNVAALCDGIDLCIISVIIDRTPEIVERIGPYLPPDAVLVDVTSIKKVPLNAMLEAHPGPVLGLHPLFGPTTSTLDKQIVVATPGRDDDACRWVIDQFSLWGSIIVMSDADEHDEIMEFVQSLRHFATFAFGQFLASKNVPLARSLEFSSPIYRLELGMVGRLFAQDASLYAEIIFATPERRALLKDYINSLNKNLEMLEKGDKSKFEQEFKKIAEWFGPFGEQAMRESSFLIDKLIERF